MKTPMAILLAILLSAGTAGEALAKKDKKKKKAEAEDPYAEYVWPPPPDEARIKLEEVYTGRADIEAKSSFKKMLIGSGPQSPFDRLRKPHAAAIDSRGRILVTDWGNAALIRFDRTERRMDVFGTRGAVALKQPLGLDLGPDDTAYVADAALRRVVAYDPEGKLVAVLGRQGELTNPTDAALSPDGKRIYVADSKAHQIHVFALESGDLVASFGKRGEGEGEFNFPTSLDIDGEGNLYVVDQINARVQVLSPDGEYLDEFGKLGVGFANFARPKDVAIDEVGFIYVVDNAFNNVQLFDADFTLLTFVGAGGRGPGRFYGASGIAVRGDEFAVVDQLGRRVQVFRFLVPKDK